MDWRCSIVPLAIFTCVLTSPSDWSLVHKILRMQTCARTLNKTTHSNHFHHWDELTYWRKLLRFKLGSLIGRVRQRGPLYKLCVANIARTEKFNVLLHQNERLQCECVDGVGISSEHLCNIRFQRDGEIVIVHSVQTNARTRIDRTYLCAVVNPNAFYHKFLNCNFHRGRVIILWFQSISRRRKIVGFFWVLISHFSSFFSTALEDCVHSKRKVFAKVKKRK